jgi:predicted house-cleaning NTP pyrophosphatase (Maf/HAM1 superfamily)
MTYPPIVLASRSPRRSQLLAQIGVPHEAVSYTHLTLPTTPYV